MIGNLTHEQATEVLQNNMLGRIACSAGDTPYIVPINYVYDGQYIIGHAVLGKKIEMMRENPQVCFAVDEIKDYTNWKSVIVHGQYQEIEKERQRYETMKLFVDKTLRLKISESALPPEISAKRVHPRSPGNIRPIIFRILITDMSGRFETTLS